jgi:hypothetical protein
MRSLIFTVLCFVLVGCQNDFPTTSTQRLKSALQKMAHPKHERSRFYALDDAAKESFNLGKREDARVYAEELKLLAEKYTTDWNYGNAIQDYNIVLGRLAIVDGRMGEAKQYLIEAGKSPGSPQMNSFGPDMSLAKDLLKKGEKDVVLEYFELCRKFWKMDEGKLDSWASEVKAGKIPNFGPY